MSVRNANWVCLKHKYSSKYGGLCPTCRKDLECLGERERIDTKTKKGGWKRVKKILDDRAAWRKKK